MESTAAKPLYQSRRLSTWWWVLAIGGLALLSAAILLRLGPMAGPGLSTERVITTAIWLMLVAITFPLALPSAAPASAKVNAEQVVAILAQVDLRCLRCGYSLLGSPLPRCPECGSPFGLSIENGDTLALFRREIAMAHSVLALLSGFTLAYWLTGIVSWISIRGQIFPWDSGVALSAFAIATLVSFGAMVQMAIPSLAPASTGRALSLLVIAAGLLVVQCAAFLYLAIMW